jgi:hypothetical protein
MAYTICDQYGGPKPIRLLLTTSDDEPKLGQPFTPYWWSCDPCNPASSRYEVTHRVDQQKPTGYAWFQVVTSDDTEEDILAKKNHYYSVIQAGRKLEEARREWERLNGFPYPR